MTGQFLKDFLLSIGIEASSLSGWILAIELSILCLIAIVSYLITRYILVAAVKKIVSRTKVEWDDDLFNDYLMSSISHIVPPVLMLVFLPYVFHDNEVYQAALLIGEKILYIYIVLVSI